MTTDVAASPLRVGLFGLGRCGLHLIERFSTGGPFRIVALLANPSVADANVADLVSPFGVRLLHDPHALLAATDVDVLWLTEPGDLPNNVALPDVLLTKHAILETPIGVTPAILDQTLAVAHQRDRRLLVRHSRRSDADYRQALSVANDQSLGPMCSAKFVSWTYAIAPRGAARGSGPLPPDASDDAPITKSRFVAHTLDQLVTLIGDRPQRVFATGDSNSRSVSDLTAGCSLSLQILFANGCQAEINIRLDSPTQIQSGWMLTAERGGYSKGRRFALTEEGEIFDSPAPLIVSDQDSEPFDGLAQQIRSADRDTDEETRLRTVVALLDMTQRSLASQQPVESDAARGDE